MTGRIEDVDTKNALGHGFAVGLPVGIAIGVGTDTLPAGIAIGIALAPAFGIGLQKATR